MILLGTPIRLFIESANGGTLGNKWEFVLPPEFEVLNRNEFFICAGRNDGLAVIATAAIYPDGVAWIHASCSRASSMPTYYDLRDMKSIVFGDDRFACQVFPTVSEHVNIHPFCLHLFGTLTAEKWPLPDFTIGSGSI